jgi:hypothetical protein
MTWLEFFASVLKSIAWPLAIIIIVFLLRNHIANLFPLLSKLKIKGFEIEFRKSLKELVHLRTIALPDSESLSDSTNEKIESSIEKIAEISPRAAIIEAWLNVEVAAAELIKKNGLLDKKYFTPYDLRKNLLNKSTLNDDQLKIFQNLRDLRNKAVHIPDFNFKTNEVIEYVNLAMSFSRYLKQLDK